MEPIRTLKYAVFVMSLDDDYVMKMRENQPNFPNLRILVKAEDLYAKAINGFKKEQARNLKLRYASNYKQIVKAYGVDYFESKVRAFQIAYKKLDEFQRKRLKADIHGESSKKYCVYCIKLKSTVWENKDFRDNNPHLLQRETNNHLNSIAGYYVGQTSKSSQERFLEHVNPKERNSTRWGKNYFPASHRDGYDEVLIKRFTKETGQSTIGLPHKKSIIVEHQFTSWIRKKGLGAYCA